MIESSEKWNIQGPHFSFSAQVLSEFSFYWACLESYEIAMEGRFSYHVVECLLFGFSHSTSLSFKISSISAATVCHSQLT